jgi:hypothetical protein
MQASASGREWPRTAPPRITENADFWRRCADVALKVAYKLKDGPAVARTLEIRRQYERFARQAEERALEAH